MRRKQLYPCDLYKAGDKVIVEPHGNNVFSRGMYDKGVVVTIRALEEYERDVYYYKIIEDGGAWWWCDNCFIPAEHDVTNKVYNVLRGLPA